MAKTGANPDYSAYLGDESYGIYVDVKKRRDGWHVVGTVDAEHFNDALPDDGPYGSRQKAAAAAVAQATDILHNNGVRVTKKERREALRFLLRP